MIETHRIINKVFEQHPIKVNAKFLCATSAQSSYEADAVYDETVEIADWIDSSAPGKFVLIKTGYHLDCKHQDDCRRRMNGGNYSFCWMFAAQFELYIVTKEDWDTYSQDIKDKQAALIGGWETSLSGKYGCDCQMKDHRGELVAAGG